MHPRRVPGTLLRVTVSNSWLVVLGPSGEVLGTASGAPAGWVGAALEGRKGAPLPVQVAAREVVAEVQGGAAVVRRFVEVPELGVTVEVVGVAALGLHRVETDVRALVRHALAALERQAMALDVGLSVTVDPNVPASICVDPEKIAWAISALAGNSMRYVRRGTRHMPGGSVSVTVGRDAEHEHLLLVVEDDGPGIPAPVLEQLFLRKPGAPVVTGLALKVVRDVVDAHGGSMEVRSTTDEDEHGTTVTVQIPIG
jgi:signal transduction histidine kinase